MYCPVCDKDFSPVHSRCPECKGWLRTAKSSSGSSSRPSGSINVPAGLAAAPGGGLAAPVGNRPASSPVNASGAGVTLPSRPVSKTGVVAVPTPASVSTRNGDGLSGGPAVAATSIPSPVNPVTSTVPIEDLGLGGRGGLGSGWEASGSFQMPTVASSSPAMGGGLNNSPPTPGAWSAPGSGVGPSLGGGLGEITTGPGSGSLSAASGLGAGLGLNQPAAGGLGGWGGGAAAAATPPGPAAAGLGSWGDSAASIAPASASGGGWLGDGGGSGSGSPSAYTAPRAGAGANWLGSGEAVASSAAPVPSSSEEMPLELPDHTVAVDLGTPWDDEELSPNTSNSKLVYAILGCLVLSLTGAFAYLQWRNHSLQQKAPVAAVQSGMTSLKLGEETLKKAQTDFAAKRYEQAQASAELAYDLLVPLKGYPKAKQVSDFYNKATTRLGQSLFDKAKQAKASGDSNQALALCNQAVNVYRKVKASSKQQAQVLAYEAGVYRSLGDISSAQATYKKAHVLNPQAGYDIEAKLVRQSAAPAATTATDVPEPLPVEEQPSISGNDSSAYPTGSGSGGYRPSSRPAAVPQAQPEGPAAKARPVNTYVPPPKKQTQRKSDVLPTY